MVDFLHSNSTQTLTGTYDFRTGVMSLPSGTEAPAGIGGRIFFIGPSGTLVLHNGSAWKYLYASGDVVTIPAIFDEAIIWMDLGAGSASGTLPTSVNTNPSGATTGGFGPTGPTYAIVSGNNTWEFANLDDAYIAGFDRFNAADMTPWVRTMAVILKVGAATDNNLVICGYAKNAGSNNQFSLENNAANNTLAINPGTVQLGFQIDNKDGNCYAFFTVVSGSRSAGNSIMSGAFYVGVNTYEVNWAASTNTAPGIASGMIGDRGATNAMGMNVFGMLTWEKALSQAERQSVVDYYANTRGVNVL